MCKNVAGEELMLLSVYDLRMSVVIKHIIYTLYIDR